MHIARLPPARPSLRDALLPQAPEPVFSTRPAQADASDLHRASVRGVALTFGSQGARVVLQFTAQIVLAHFLLPSQFGIVAMVAPVLALVQVFNDLGLTQATVQRSAITQSELSALFWINLAVSLVLAALLIAAAPLVARFYAEPQLVGITAAAGAMLVLSGAAAQQIALLNRHMRYGALAGIDVACACVAFGVGLAAAAAGCGAWSLIFMQAGNSATILVLAWAVSDWRPGPPRRTPGIGSLLAFGGHLTGFNLLGYLETNLSTLLIGRLDGTAAIGLYDRANKLVIVPWWQVSLPIDRVAVSLLSRLAGTSEAYRRAHRLMLQGLLLVAAPGLLWAGTQAGPLVPLVLGAAWGSAAPIVGTLALATMPVPFAAAAYWLFVSQGRVRVQVHYGLVSGGALLASLLCGLHWGPLGVARAYGCFAPIIIGAPLWGATRTGPVTMRHVAQASWPILAGLAASALALLAWPVSSGPWAAAWLAADLALAYAACLVTMLALPQGRRVLADVWTLRRMLRDKDSLPG